MLFAKRISIIVALTFLFGSLAIAHPGHPLLKTKDVAATIADLQGTDVKKQLSSARMLGFVTNSKVQPQAAQALISAYQADSSPDLKYQIAYSLGTLGKIVGAPGKAVLLQALKDEHPAVKAVSIRALSRVGEDSEEVLQLIRAELKSKDPHVRYRAAKYLTEQKSFVLDEEVLVVVSSLITNKIRLDEDEVVHFPADWVAANLFSALDHGEVSRVITAHNLVEKLEPMYLVAASHGVANVRRAAVYGLFRLGSKNSASIEALKPLVNDEDEITQLTALLTLGNMGESARVALPLVVEKYKSSEGRMRAQAVYALGKIGIGSSEAFDLLLKGLDDRSISVRIYSTEALGSLGAAAAPAVSKLSDGINNKELPKALRLAIAKALRDIGTPEAQSVIETFRKKVLSEKSKTT